MAFLNSTFPTAVCFLVCTCFMIKMLVWDMHHSVHEWMNGWVFDAWTEAATTPHRSLNVAIVSCWHTSPFPSLLSSCSSEAVQDERAALASASALYFRTHLSFTNRQELNRESCDLHHLIMHGECVCVVCVYIWEGGMGKVFLSIIRAWLVLR